VTVASLSTGIAAVGALWFTNMSLQATRQQVAIAEQGQYTDRYTKAVEQLGSEEIDVRLGAIYALERLAFDSTRDRTTIGEVLAVYARNRSTPLEKCGAPVPRQFATPAPKSLPSDVKAAITVHQRLRLGDVALGSIDLSYICLVDTELGGMDLQAVKFAGANFSGANLSHANLRDVNLAGALLPHAALYSTDLQNANIAIADLSGAALIGADLGSAYLVGANLRHAFLTYANLQGANLRGADLSDASLSHASLRAADMNNAKLTGANLDSADLAGVKGLK
jgi:uncharacterized protein YjbI with pentapeptide repeats